MELWLKSINGVNGMHKNKTVAAQPRLLIETDNPAESAIVSDILSQNGIVPYVRGRGIGGNLEAFVGYSPSGDVFYVDEEDYTRAHELMEEIAPCDLSKQ